MAKARRKDGPVTVQDILAVRTQSLTLLGMLEEERDLLARADVDPIAALELKGAVAAIEGEIKIPSAKQMMVASLTSGLSKDLILTLYHRATQAMHAMAPIVAFKLAEHMDDAKAKGNPRVLIAIAKGIGLFVPAEPIKTKDRMDLMDKTSIQDRTDEDLRAELLLDT